MRRKVLSLFVLLIFSLGYLPQGSHAYGLDSSNVKKMTSYYYIHFNGEKQEIVLNEDVSLTLTGWADVSKSSVKGEINIHTDSIKRAEETTIEVGKELKEITITGKESTYYRLDVSDSFNVEQVKPQEINDQITVVAKNENGTSIEEVKTIDEYDTIIEQKGLTYYSTDENNQKIVVSKEEYDSLNPVLVSSPVVQSSKDVTRVEEGSSVKELSSFSAQSAAENPTISYSTHVQNIGWQKAVANGEMSGTQGEAKRLESIKISVNNVADLGVKYSTHVQDHGWLEYVSNGEESGTTGQAKRLEAIKIELTGNKATNYDVFYRVHTQDYGWMDWVKNGELAGTIGKAKRLEAIEIMIKPKEPIILEPSVTYKTFVQSYGWLDAVSNGELGGTVDQAKRLEALQITLDNAPYTGGITYKTHVQDYGWLENVSEGETSGFTNGENKRVESVQVNLTGEMATNYDIYYRVYQQSFGWVDWVKNGESAGKEGLSKQLEAIEVVLVEKGEEVPGANLTEPSVVYSTHVETYGWLDFSANGAMSGTEGKAKRLEAIKINLQDAPYSGDIIYSTHVQDYGWLNTVSDGIVSGTSGESKRLEAIQINLTGDIANYYDVYYRVHAQDYGWLGWAKNGMKAGTEGYSKRLEAIEIKLVPKGTGVAVNENEAYKQRPTIVFLDPGHGGSDPGAVSGVYHEADLNLAVAKKVQSLLVNRGYKVIMSRETDTKVELLNRPQMANTLKADIFVSIHTNSTDAPITTATGIEGYYYDGAMHNNPERISKSMTLANIIQKNMVGYTGARDRGTDGSSLAVIREAAMPATLVEMGFINNPSDRQKLFTDSYQNQLAKSIVDGIDKYFKIY